MYKNEEFVGAAIRQSGIPREQLFLTSKWAAIGGDDVRAELSKTLEKVRTPRPQSWARPGLARETQE